MRARGNARLARLWERFGRRRVHMLGLLLIAGLASLAIQLLGRYDIDRTAMMYLAVPYSVAVLITMLRPYDERKGPGQQYLSHVVSAFVVFLASSVILLEGFICALFFMPIYLLFVTAAFAAGLFDLKRDGRRGKTFSTAIPLLVVVFSIEGTSELTTFERLNTATATATTAISPEQLLKNLASPFDLPSSSDWMLGLFPMPHTIEAGSLHVGDFHRVHTRYHRWFVTNTHDGVIDLRIDSVAPRQVTVSFVRDTSYFSSYVRLIDSEIRISTENGMSHVALTVRYERLLDPAWYFQPIQQYAMRTMAAHLIEEVIIRD